MEDPRRKVIADILCPQCNGSGLDPDIPVDEVAIPVDEAPCKLCRATGLSPMLLRALECGDLDRLSLFSSRRTLTKAVEGLYKTRQVIKELLPTTGNEKAVDEALGALVNELTGLLGELDPDPQEKSDD